MSNTRSPLTRQIVHYRLQEVQTLLLSAIVGLSEAELKATPMTPDWSALDIVRHLSVWIDLTARTLANWHGKQNWVLRDATLDDFNAEMVAERANTPLDEVIQHIVNGYSEYAKTLLDCTDEELQERTIAPWDRDMSRLEMIYGVLEHDLYHLKELKQVLRQS